MQFMSLNSYPFSKNIRFTISLGDYFFGTRHIDAFVSWTFSGCLQSPLCLSLDFDFLFLFLWIRIFRSHQPLNTQYTWLRVWVWRNWLSMPIFLQNRDKLSWKDRKLLVHGSYWRNASTRIRITELEIIFHINSFG